MIKICYSFWTASSASNFSSFYYNVIFNSLYTYYKDVKLYHVVNFYKL